MQIHRPPQIPRRCRAPWRPALSIGQQLAHSRQCLAAVGNSKAIAHAEIRRRQHVGPSQLKHQHHLHRPAADAAHGGQSRDDGFVIERVQCAALRHLACARFRREITQRRDLARRESCAAQRRIIKCEHCAGSREAVLPFRVGYERHKPRGDRPRGRTADLLSDDRSGEMSKGRITRLHTQAIGSRRLDQCSHHRVERCEVRRERTPRRLRRYA